MRLTTAWNQQKYFSHINYKPLIIRSWDRDACYQLKNYGLSAKRLSLDFNCRWLAGDSRGRQKVFSFPRGRKLVKQYLALNKPWRSESVNEVTASNEKKSGDSSLILDKILTSQLLFNVVCKHHRCLCLISFDFLIWLIYHLARSLEHPPEKQRPDAIEKSVTIAVNAYTPSFLITEIE